MPLVVDDRVVVLTVYHLVRTPFQMEEALKKTMTATRMSISL